MRLQVQPRDGALPPRLGDPELPGCKSHSQRALLLAGLAGGEWRLEGVLRSEDVDHLCDALRALGARIDAAGEVLTVVGRRGRLRADVFVGENGTAARTLAVMVPMLGGSLRLDGRDGLRRRPMTAAADFLRHHGAKVDGSALPLAVDGEGVRWPEILEVDASLTTQVASGVLLGLAARPSRLFGLHGGTTTVVRCLAPAAPDYLRLTAGLIRAFGGQIEEREDGDALEFRVRSGGVRSTGTYAVPRDPSARSFPLALAAMLGVDVPSLARPDGVVHPELAVDEDVAAILKPGDTTIDGLGARPDSFPALVALAASRTKTTHFVAVPNLRHKESDRIAAMVAGLNAIGVEFEEREDGLSVTGPLPSGEKAGETAGGAAIAVPTAPDHRIVMALALLGAVRPGGVVVEHAMAVRKSWPGFFEWLERVADVQLGPSN